MEVDTDSGKSDNGWVDCKKPSEHHLPQLGDPILCAGATFTISRKYSRKFLFSDELEVGKIHSIVRRHGSSVPFFKFYNLLEYPDQPPVQGSSSYKYHECEKMMSTNEKITGIKWTARSSGAPKNRARKQFYQKEYSVASRGLYDGEDKLDALRRKQLQERQDGKRDSECSSSDDDDDDVPLPRSNNKRVCDTSSSSEDDNVSSDSEREATADYWNLEQW